MLFETDFYDARTAQHQELLARRMRELGEKGSEVTSYEDPNYPGKEFYMIGDAKVAITDDPVFHAVEIRGNLEAREEARRRITRLTKVPLFQVKAEEARV